MKIKNKSPHDKTEQMPLRPDKSQAKTKLSSRKKSSSKTISDPVEDLDALLAEVKLTDSTCRYSKCSKNVSLLGAQCQFCKSRFCMEHSLAEIHGCGDAAKEKARKDIQREGRHNIIGSRPYGLSGVRRSQVQMKLTKELEDKATARESKKADSKSKQQK